MNQTKKWGCLPYLLGVWSLACVPQLLGIRGPVTEAVFGSTRAFDRDVTEVRHAYYDGIRFTIGYVTESKMKDDLYWAEVGEKAALEGVTWSWTIYRRSKPPRRFRDEQAIKIVKVSSLNIPYPENLRIPQGYTELLDTNNLKPPLLLWDDRPETSQGTKFRLIFSSRYEDGYLGIGFDPRRQYIEWRPIPLSRLWAFPFACLADYPAAALDGMLRAVLREGKW